MGLPYLALGDSYTIAEGLRPRDSWACRLARLLAREGVPLAPPLIIARTGWTADELLAAVEAARPRGPFALVSLLAGVNDQYRGLPLAGYRRDVRALLGRAAALARAPGRVLVLSIPDWSVTPFAEGRERAALAREIDAFNAVKREESLAAGAGWVDITPLSRALARSPGGLARDGLHYSGAAHLAFAEAALPAARAALAGAASA